MFLTWNENYSVNIKELDDQHKIWLGLINNLYDAIKVGKGEQALNIIIEEIKRYTVYHFEYEEKLLAKYNYPDESRHKKTHDDYAAEVRELMKTFNEGGNIKSSVVLEQMKNWLVNHIMKSDKQYSEFLNSKGVF